MLSVAALVVASSMVVGQPEGEKAFKAYTELVVGGVWTNTTDGKKQEHTYEPILGGRFVQQSQTVDREPVTVLQILGVDPDTGRFTWWTFSGDGNVGSLVASQSSPGVWMLEGQGNGPNGKATFKASLTKVDANTITLQTLEVTLSGKKQEPEASWVSTWTRTKK